MDYFDRFKILACPFLMVTKIIIDKEQFILNEKKGVFEKYARVICIEVVCY